MRNTRPADFDAIIQMTRRVYRGREPWGPEQLASHLRVFPEGQLVADHAPTGRVVGMAASLMVWWEDYDVEQGWRDFTERGMFTNHDPDRGRTLYGAELMVHPDFRRRGIARRMYAVRRELARALGLVRIRAGSRLAGYHRHAEEMDAYEYVRRVIAGELGDPTLSFQLGEGFEVIAIVPGYLPNDPESRGWAAVIEWLNPDAAAPEDFERRAKSFPDPA